MNIKIKGLAWGISLIFTSALQAQNLYQGQKVLPNLPSTPDLTDPSQYNFAEREYRCAKLAGDPTSFGNALQGKQTIELECNEVEQRENPDVNITKFILSIDTDAYGLFFNTPSDYSMTCQIYDFAKQDGEDFDALFIKMENAQFNSNQSFAGTWHRNWFRGKDSVSFRITEERDSSYAEDSISSYKLIIDCALFAKTKKWNLGLTNFDATATFTSLPEANPQRVASIAWEQSEDAGDGRILCDYTNGRFSCSQSLGANPENYDLTLYEATLPWIQSRTDGSKYEFQCYDAQAQLNLNLTTITQLLIKSFTTQNFSESDLALLTNAATTNTVTHPEGYYLFASKDVLESSSSPRKEYMMMWGPIKITGNINYDEFQQSQQYGQAEQYLTSHVNISLPAHGCILAGQPDYDNAGEQGLVNLLFKEVARSVGVAKLANHN